MAFPTSVSILRVVGMLIVSVMSLVGAYSASSALAATPTIAQPVLTAPFENTNKIIKLNGSWGEAHACVIWQQRDATRCFHSLSAMQRYTDMVEKTTQTGVHPHVSTSSCASYLYLYQDINYGGRVLQFRDRGYWQNLTTYNFNDQLSSYVVGACGVHLAEAINGVGLWYPGDTSANARSGCMCAGTTNWNDRVSSIYIQ